AALADSGQADVGFDRDYHVALVEGGVEVLRLVDAHAGNLRFGKSSFGIARSHCRGTADAGEPAEKRTPVHIASRDCLASQSQFRSIRLWGRGRSFCTKPPDPTVTLVRSRRLPGDIEDPCLKLP